MTLPAELRLEIWRHLLQRAGYVRSPDEPVERYFFDPPMKRIEDTAVLRLCRQVYDEGIEILYRVNTFDLTSTNLFWPGVNRSLHRLRHISIRFVAFDLDQCRCEPNVRPDFDEWIAVTLQRLFWRCSRMKTCEVIFPENVTFFLGPYLHRKGRIANAICGFSYLEGLDRLDITFYGDHRHRNLPWGVSIDVILQFMGTLRPLAIYRRVLPAGKYSVHAAWKRDKTRNARPVTRGEGPCDGKAK